MLLDITIKRKMLEVLSFYQLDINKCFIKLPIITKHQTS